MTITIQHVWGPRTLRYRGTTPAEGALRCDGEGLSTLQLAVDDAVSHWTAARNRAPRKLP